MSEKFTGSDDVVSREVGGEMVLLDLASGTYFGLNAVGGRIWQMLEDGPHSLAELCDTIESEFDAPRSAIEDDVVALAEDMVQRNLIIAHPN